MIKVIKAMGLTAILMMALAAFGFFIFIDWVLKAMVWLNNKRRLLLEQTKRNNFPGAKDVV